MTDALVACHDCGRLHRWRPLGRGERARCTRCSGELYRWHDARRPATMVAVTLGAMLVYLIAQCFPIVSLDMAGLTTSATLLGAIRVLWDERMQVIAAMVFFFAIAFPALELGALLYVSFGLWRGRRVRGFNMLLRTVQGARHWAMTEVFMIGVLVTTIKMTSLARVTPHPGLFAFGALTVLAAMALRFEPRALWAMGDRLPGARPAPVPVPATPGLPSGFLTCHACGLVNRALAQRPRPHQRCARCATRLHARIPHSIERTWALLAAAALLYVPANILPIMYTASIGGTEGDTIMSGVLLFWRGDSPGLAVIIFVASIAVPVLKLAALGVLAATAQLRSRRAPVGRTRLYRLVEFIGRWSMLDIFVVALTVALVRFQALATITPGPGALAFGCVVILTMVASAQFDPRLIWDPVDSHGEQRDE
ncbi:paraquat-inducible protein A [uncultured Massilia sp.]|uniref:paraquat-inducible protein A n=1 Tax=uncultured Massilia sp. TaxID=169973 RepID=UPI0025FD3A53|nr:paraquat-inducible protein A [uncultured Massilia sp.]